MSSLVRVTCLCVVWPGQHRSDGLEASRMVRLCRRERGAAAVAAVGKARARRLSACVLGSRPEGEGEQHARVERLEQAIDDVSHAEQVVGVRRATQPREETSNCTDVRWQGLPWARGMDEGRAAACVHSRSLLVARSIERC